MFDRHWLGDLALAVLLALPLVGVAKAQPYRHPAHATSISTIGSAMAQSPDGRMSLLG